MTTAGTPTTEFGTRLVLDDAATETLQRIAGHMHHVAERVNETRGELAGMAKQAVATALGFQFDRGIETLKEIGHEAYAAATGAMAQQKHIAGVLAMTDKTGASYEEAKAKAVELHGELEDVGIAAGVATDQVIGAFTMIAERSERSTEEVFKLTQQMAVAGKAMPGGVEQIAGAFRDLETGIVRPRNALVLMMKQTGVMGGSVKQISRYMSQLMQGGEAGQAQAFKLAEAAIMRMSEKMKNAPPSFTGVIQSLKDIRENIYEAMGIPMLKAITKPLNQLKLYLQAHQKELEAWGEVVGKQIGEWVVEAAEKMRQGFQYIQSHAEEIKQALTLGAQYLKQAIEFAVAHRGLLTAVNVVKTGAQVVSAGQAGYAALGALAPALGMSAGGLAAVLPLLIADFALLAKLGWDIHEALHGREDADTKVRWEELQRAAHAGDVKQAKAMKEALDLAHFSTMDQLAVADSWVKAAEKTAKEQDRAANAVRAAMFGGEGGIVNLDAVASIYDQAIKQNDKKTQEFVMDLLTGSRDVQDGFFRLSEAGLEGAKQLQAALSKVDIKGAEAIERVIKTAAQGGVTMNFPGAKIDIKQDFKDQDPDRIAAVFREDLAKHAFTRIGSQFSDVFGL